MQKNLASAPDTSGCAPRSGCYVRACRVRRLYCVCDEPALDPLTQRASLLGFDFAQSLFGAGPSRFLQFLPCVLIYHNVWRIAARTD